MTDQSNTHSPSCAHDEPDHGANYSRRRMLRVLAGGAAAAATVGIPALARANGGLLSVGGAASALEAAERLPGVPPSTTLPDDSDTDSIDPDASGDTEDPDADTDVDPDVDPDASVDPDVEPGIERPPEGFIAFPLAAASDCYVLDNFGDCRSGCSRLHEGVDIMGSRYQPVYAVADGVLTTQYNDRGLSWGAGNGWTLHDEENDVVYKFFHLDSHAEGLSEGDSVVFGQVIGYVGKTGTSGANNYHLHFEYRPGNRAVNPLPLMVVPDDQCGVSPPIRG